MFVDITKVISDPRGDKFALGACFRVGSYEVTGNFVTGLAMEGHWH